ncbi:MAG TPA: dihydroorotate dehydrogenase [Spirochaetia bacterium]|nr:dihydroorotate dehydrogenase [Spirochaetia bacterium]
MCAQPSISPDLSCRVAGVRLPTPLVLASGIWGTSPSLLERAARSGAGAVTAKTCTPAPRRGHRNPTAVDWGAGLINAMGLPNPGAEEEADLLREAARRLRPLGVPLIASISADTAEQFARCARLLSETGAELIELNISCPNLEAGHGEMFAASAEAAADVTRKVKAVVDLPCIVKLSPNVNDISAVARAVVDAGADAITAINTMPGMIIDAQSGRPVLANSSGGISGPALKPIALRCVYEIAAAVDVPIIGTGGVLTGVDAVEMISAGAMAVGVGSAAFYRGEHTFQLIRDELVEWMKSRGVTGLDRIRGRARRPAGSAPVTELPPVPGWEKQHG